MEESARYITIEPVRKSIFLLLAKLFALIFITDFLYTFLLFMTLQEEVTFEWHHHITLGLLFIQILKSVIQILGVLAIIFSWIQDVYFIYPQERKLITEKGLLNGKKNIYDLKNMREIIVKQGVMGKLFRFGDIVISTSASGGYNHMITLDKVHNPHKVENLLKSSI